ncbi:deazaflavin-dependent oxidoreductase (nitroreductase family) [Micromonospora pisi]|uniref:Deazaflavin-dependent oxidoreductase (Nitroreductase family) n=1 Tax=Micromonospora pisi TaxID=589240 RepID=A0A495JWC0_9ACTN|nr:nitroreductase/quinone reductase family protein [Micromonospora pisi]RKR93171.1 deazaflavin-dependent oxidoreductase (nitroreductase family) [Micromonospora pisi]
MPNDFNQQVIEEFRANGGRVGGYFEGARLLLLTTTGARSGAEHTTPLGYLPDGGERVLVIGSAGGARTHPDWFHNIVADPHVTVEDGVFVYDAVASVLEGDERDLVFARAVEADQGWGDYQSRSGRVLPVVALRQVPGPPRFAAGPDGVSWGAALRTVHDAFRRELALIRAEVAASGPGLGAQLRVNCLTVCQGLHLHHTGEDAGMFPALAEGRPELAPTMERLRREHQRIAELVDDLRAVLSADGVDPVALLADVERLTDELVRHLAYEEERLIPVLDGSPTREQAR